MTTQEKEAHRELTRQKLVAENKARAAAVLANIQQRLAMGTAQAVSAEPTRLNSTATRARSVTI